MILISSRERVYGPVKVESELWEKASKLAGGKMLLARQIGEHLAQLDTQIPDELRKSYRSTPWRAAFGKGREGLVEDYLNAYVREHGRPAEGRSASNVTLAGAA